jgi:hypothetical protein
MHLPGDLASATEESSGGDVAIEIPIADTPPVDYLCKVASS